MLASDYLLIYDEKEKLENAFAINKEKIVAISGLGTDTFYPKYTIWTDDGHKFTTRNCPELKRLDKEMFDD